MPLHGKAAGGLAADYRISLRHFRGNVFEADRNLIALLSKPLRNAVEQVRGGIVAHARAAPAAVLDEIVVQQHKELVRVDELPVIVDNAKPVRISVGGNAEVTAVAVKHHCGQRPHGLFVRRGELAAEKRVMPVVDYLKVTAAGHEDHAQAGLADTVHRVKRDA